MRLIARLTALAAALILVVSCLGDPTGPSTRLGGLALQPRFANATAAAIVDIRDVRVVLRRPGESRIVVDTVVPFPTTRDTLVLGVEVPLIARTEQMELTLAMTNSLGDTVFRAGPILVTASTDPSGQTPAEPLFTYVGTGANASGVRFVEPPVAVLYGQSVTFVAEAFDGQQTPIDGTPVGFELVNATDSVFAKFVPAGSATLVAGTQRASVQVRALLPGGQSAIHVIAVQPAATIIQELPGGDMQSGTVGMPLALPLEARLFGDDELPVQGEIVELVLVNGVQDTVLTQRDTSDATGLVSFIFTLPTTRSGYVATARVVSNPALAVAYLVEGLPAASSTLEMRIQPGASIAGQPLSPSLEVYVLDEFGNENEAATEPITVALGDNPDGLGVLSGTLTLVPVNGVAVFNDLSVQRAAAGYTLVATSGALTPDTSTVFDIAAGAPAGLGFFVQPPLAVETQTPFSVVVGAVDAFGNPAPTWSGTVTVALGANPGQGTLGGTLTGNSVNGTVTFTDLQVDNVAAGYSLGASASIGVVTSNTFDVNPPASVNAWTNVNGGNWSNSANWSQGTVPTSSDTVWVKAEGTYTVNLDGPVTVARLEMGAVAGTQTLSVPVGGSLTVADSALLTGSVALEQSGGGIGGPGYIGVAGSYSWTGGNITGAGTTRVLAGGTLAIGGAGTSTFTERTVELLGTGVWTGTAQISSGNGATLRVAAGATLDIQGDPVWGHVLGGTPSVLDVAGVVTRSTSTGTAAVPQVLLEGTLNANSGSLAVVGGASVNGTLNVATGVQVVLSGPSHVFGAGSAVQGAGDVTIPAGTTVTSGGTWAVAGATNVLGTLTYNGGAGSTGTLVLQGTRGGTGALSVASGMTWVGGTLSGTGTTVVPAGATLLMSGAMPRTMTEHTLEIAGMATWDDDAPLHAGLGAMIISSGIFDWIGNGSIIADVGGTLPVFENRGTFSRNASGMAQSGAVMVDTIGTEWRLDGGDLQLLNGARMGGNPYTGGNLELVSGTLSMEDGTAWDADGGVLRALGGIVTVDSGGRATIPFFELWGGTLSHEGTVEITGNLDWTAGRIESNTAGLGGRTRIMPNVALGTSGAAVKELFGTHVIEVAYDPPSESGGHFVFDGTGDLRAGGGARIENHARVWMAGPAAMLSNLGSPMAVFENTATGSLEVEGLPVGTRVMGLAMDNVGFMSSFNGDTLRLTGGSVTNFGGFVSTEVGALDLAAGTYTLTEPWDVQASLLVSGSALLDVGSDTAFVRMDLTTASGGRIRSVSDVALLRVDGNAVFGGGAGELTAGRLELFGDFQQSGLNTSFQATGSHVTSFGAAAPQAISFTSPTPVTSHFQDLEIFQTDSIAILSDVHVAGALNVLDGRIGGAQPWRLVVAGDVDLENADGSNPLRPFVLEVGGLFTNEVAGITPDTLVLNRAATYVWDGTMPSGPHLRFNTGTVTFQATSSPGDLIASGNARIVMPTGNRAVLGNFATQDGGILQMGTGSDLSVNGNATFAGGGTVGQLTGGRLSVAGNFVQSSVNNNASFAPTLAHSTVLNGAGAQVVSFDTPAQSQFYRLRVESPAARTVSIATDVHVLDSLVMMGGAQQSELRGSGTTQRLIVDGILMLDAQTAYPRVAPPVLELSRAPVIDSIFSGLEQNGIHADTIVYTGGVLTQLPSARPLQYRSVRVSTANTLSLNTANSFPDSIRGDLQITSGGVSIDNATFGMVVTGDLETSGTGTLRMQSAFQTLNVNGDARFLGGSTAGLLTNGTLRVHGDFEQGGPNASSFQASNAHTVEFAGNVIQNVLMASPGAGASQFANFDVNQPVPTASRVNLLSDVLALVVRDSSEGVTDEIRSTVGALLTAGRASVGNTIFDGVRLSLTDGAAFHYLSFPSFQNISPTSTFLTVNVNAGNVATFNGLAFVDAPPTPGLYFELLGGGTLNFTNAIPLTSVELAGRYQRSGTAIWNGQQLP